MSNADIAKNIKVTPSTLSIWINHSDFFAKKLKEEELKAESERKRRYKSAAQLAINKLIDLVESSDDKTALAACKDILDRAGDKPSDKVDLSGTLEMTNKLDSILRQLSDDE